MKKKISGSLAMISESGNDSRTSTFSGRRGYMNGVNVPVQDTGNDSRTSTFSSRRGYMNGVNVPVHDTSELACDSKSQRLKRRLSFSSPRKKAGEGAAAAAARDKPGTSTNKPPGQATVDGEPKVIDFDRIEANLKAFEEFYRAWIQNGAENEQNPTGKYSTFSLIKLADNKTEVHLVAMVSKRGELVRSVKEGGKVVGKEVPEIVVSQPTTRASASWTDCAL
jgi:hypothetical protein